MAAKDDVPSNNFINELQNLNIITNEFITGECIQNFTLMYASKSINSKNKLYKKLIQTYVAGNVESYNQLKIRFNRFRNIFRQSIKDAKRLYF